VGSSVSIGILVFFFFVEVIIAVPSELFVFCLDSGVFFGGIYDCLKGLCFSLGLVFFCCMDSGVVSSELWLLAWIMVFCVCSSELLFFFE